MRISELERMEINEPLAYIIGLIYPLLKIKSIQENEFLIGSVNHNNNMSDIDDINAHFLNVYTLFKSLPKNIQPKIVSNKSLDFKITSKDGFSVLITIDKSKDLIEDILKNKILEIEKSNDSVKKYFIMGCFDGRGSWDKTGGYLSIDADRNYDKQELIENIIRSMGIDVNLNRRSKEASRNDQIRIKKNSLKLYVSNIGFLSVYRKKLLTKVTEK